MNTPIDPRTGDRRQKALRARLQAMAGNNSSAKALLGKLGQSRGRVQAAGPRGSGIRIAQNGAARPGVLNFLQAPGFGMGHGQGQGPVGGPAMNAISQPINLHAPTALPTQPLNGPPVNPALDPATNPFAPQAPEPDPVPQWAQDLQSQGQQVIDYGPVATDPSMSPTGPMTSSGLIPIGGGRYFDPTTGAIHGGGSRNNFAI